MDYRSFSTLGSTRNGSRQRHQLHRQLWHKFQYPTLGEITRILWRQHGDGVHNIGYRLDRRSDRILGEEVEAVH